jgi:HPt (histidine-containing phosphotransfer) domain-containing protein
VHELPLSHCTPHADNHKQQTDFDHCDARLRGPVNQFNQTEATWNDAGIDLSNLLARVEYDHELLSDLLLVFTQEFPPAYRLLKEAAERRDQTQIQIIAHTLKGMLASLSFVRAATLAARIERSSHEPAMEGIEEYLQRLEVETAAAQISLTQVCEGVLT